MLKTMESIESIGDLKKLKISLVVIARFVTISLSTIKSLQKEKIRQKRLSLKIW